MTTKTSNKFSKKTGKRTKKKVLQGSRMLFAGTGILFSLLMLYLFPAVYYRTHLYNNTIINGISTSNMTVSEAEKAINAEVESYRLTLNERNSISDSIWGLHIDLHTVYDSSISEFLENQNTLMWPVSMFQPHTINIKTMLEYNEDLLKLYFQDLNCFDDANVIEPKNATISEYGENGFEIVPEDQGAKVIKEKLYASICNAINTLEPTLSIEESGCYEAPELTSKNPGLQEALKKMNRIAGAQITYEFGNDTEILNGNKISEWLSVDENFNVALDTSKIKEYVDYIGKTYNSFGRIREFKTSYDKVIKVEGGDYGWWLNRAKELEELTKLILNGEKQKRVPVYLQTAQQYGKDDIGDTYVEVNLTAQHLYFYKEGKLVVESDFVSGNVSKNLGTPTGTYPLQYKENEATLVGEDYSTPVKYWMPFNKNIGLHDASWRDEFGKDIYLTKGSHGCINMPPAAAKKVFQDIKRGVAIVVYELPGTENYELEEDTTKVDTLKEDTTKEDAIKEDTLKENILKEDATKKDIKKKDTATH